MNSIIYRSALLLCLVAPLSFSSARAQSAFETSALCENGECSPAISAVTYGGRDAFKLTNGKTEAIIVPQIGRVMRFGKVGGPNLLWNAADSAPKNAGWKNYGGDKTWLAPQSSWKQFHSSDNWPPDPAFDGKPHRSEVLSGGKLRMTTPLSPTGIRISRTFYFDDKGEFVIEQTATKEKGAPVRAGIWSITQVVPGEAIFMARNRNSTYAEGFHKMGNVGEAQKIEVVNPNLLRITPSSAGAGGKIGVDSPISSLVSVRDGVAFLQKAIQPAGLYPDGEGGAGFPTELYINGDAKAFYVEMEILGPLKNFAVGGKSTHTVRWSLHDLPSKNVESPALVATVEKLIFGGQQITKPVISISPSPIDLRKISATNLVLAPALPNLTTLITLPDVKEMRDFQIEAGLTMNKPAITQTEFQQLISSSTPLTADDALLKVWHYAPWCSGSFRAQDKTYRFGLYLGGLGWLQTPDGQRGMFKQK
ncbi:protein of unknown function (DUF4380) [Abditibacterium utsteinense]|uniref:DUF4380 domain-containing protein n=1 Tax=Abditibacterium utsteinense TaxID=1960156 RepID=A0A2S8SQJ3_9BACT|nr:DUF4380 domain-containing protein [Abditibacterium utsteinense]PQV63019.1 protein of unknown function (DUF4380) [Abditibacterium utsteinense]